MHKHEPAKALRKVLHDRIRVGVAQQQTGRGRRRPALGDKDRANVLDAVVEQKPGGRIAHDPDGWRQPKRVGSAFTPRSPDPIMSWKTTSSAARRRHRDDRQSSSRSAV